MRSGPLCLGSRARRAILGAAVVSAIAALLIVPSSGILGYEQYSNGSGNGRCASCHGYFFDPQYVSLADGQLWPDSLHEVHASTMLNNDCYTCHSSDGVTPYIGHSDGGEGLPGYSCMGCHGRAEDGSGTGTLGFGAGLRQRHWRSSVTICNSCHNDADPSERSVVPETVKPPYFANPGTNHPAISRDPCNPGPSFNESFAGSSRGLDNDGNGFADMNDAECLAAAPTPGESGRASPLRVTSYNPASGALSIQYGVACAATDHAVEYGPLSGVSAYLYGGQVCSLGTSGTATFTLPPGSQFFLVVGHTATAEGSYGTNSSGLERPGDTGRLCSQPRDLSRRCD